MNKTKDFHLKQFSIYGGKSGMAVSTDGILLGAWADLKESQTILDIGTGTGLLALMCAQRAKNAQITALDIDSDAIAAATENVKKSPWPDRISVIHSNIHQYQPIARFESIICNPPYFNSGETTNWQARATARHTHSLSHQDLLNDCQRLLQPTGEAHFILPKVEGEQFIEMAQGQGWFVRTLCRVNTTKRKPCYRLLFTLTRQSVECHESELTINQDNGYSPEYIALTKDFYLKM
ncbi:MAG: tRNA1(Val) (adenine(37)-N6)-methyltransferase [Vibrio sp.]